MGVLLPYLYGKIQIAALGPLGCLLDGLSCSQKNICGLGDFGPLLEDYGGNLGKNSKNSKFTFCFLGRKVIKF